MRSENITTTLRARTRPLVFGALGLLGLCLLIWIDSWADARLANFFVVLWASGGVAVLVGGIIVQCQSIRQDRVPRPGR
ncbi:hypothetical protein [Streptomyces sp. NBC_01304]|uniref:hypothetical protein n=1 Tax=Streptomyces sp. NBC_01304 TaxID=2903818 RepID=UPI002E0F2EF5|nr:hypothetical protein OG430_40670 [Streptomyces sp. NBC_01304]